MLYKFSERKMKPMNQTPLTNQTPLEIGMLLYPGFTMLDLVGPMTAFAMHSNIRLLSKTLDPVPSDTAGVAILPTVTLNQCPPKLDVLFVPGGFGTADAMRDAQLIEFVRHAGSGASYITSVCLGALILGAAGLLDGYQATTHWAAHEQLRRFGAVPVKARVVTDRNRFTGGGVTAGIDFGLTLLARLRGENEAQAVQLMMEYAPDPPFDAGSPDTASPAIVKRVQKVLAETFPV
jgi:cyclohexyl-isocyanide hydratase